MKKTRIFVMIVLGAMLVTSLMGCQPAAPAAPEAPAAPVFTTPAPAGPGTINELPAAPAPLPQPTAPFSSPAPASLGERVIEPLTNLAPQGPVDLSAQMEQALNTPVAPAPGVPPTPPAL